MLTGFALPHHTAEPGAWQAAPLLLVVAALALGYVAAALRAAGGPRGWSQWRTTAWLLGCTVAAVALSPVLPDHDPRAHMGRHLLLGMVTPLALVLAAPVSLLLRSTGRTTRRWIGRALRSRPVHVLGHPATAALLSVGGLYVVMLTPFHHAADANPVLHNALHAHYLAAGYLFAWSVAGPDPAPRRPGMTTRVSVLVLATAAHAVLAKILYTRAAEEPEFQAAARLMYYGGDLAELALATALFTTWYRRQPGRHRHGVATVRQPRRGSPNACG